jgi:tetratricopeptide (TPR) repeat protein
MRYCFISLLAALCFVATPGTGSAAQPAESGESEVARANAHLQTLRTAWDAADFESVIENAAAISALPLFTNQSPDFISRVMAQKGYAHWQLDQIEEALAAYDLAEKTGAGLARIAYWRGYLHFDEENWTESQADFLRLSTLNPDVFSAPETRTYFSILNGLEEQGETPRQRALLEAIVERYQPEQSFISLQGFRLRLARILARDGDARAALQQVQPILSGQLRASVRTEIVFEPLWGLDTFDILTDVRSGVSASLSQAERHAEEYPDYLEPRHQQVQSLLVLGRFEEAETRARAAIAAAQAGTFSDSEDYLNWITNSLAYALYAQGKMAQGNQVLADAAQIDEYGLSNVSQVINLAAMYNAQGRHLRALEVFEQVTEDSVSDYGDMWVRSGRACALFALDRRTEASALIPALLADWENNASAAQQAVLCADDDEAALTLMLQRLGDETHAPGALDALQQYQSLYAPGLMPFRDLIRARFDRLRDNPEVLGAVSEVGRIERYDIINAYWGSY